MVLPLVRWARYADKGRPGTLAAVAVDVGAGEGEYPLGCLVEKCSQTE